MPVSVVMPGSALFKGGVLPSTTTYTYPIADMTVKGPYPVEDNDLYCITPSTGQPFWKNGLGIPLMQGAQARYFSGL